MNHFDLPQKRRRTNSAYHSRRLEIMNFTKYENYKDSDLEWLGDIPEDWEIRRLKDIATIKGGQDQKRVVDESGKYPVYGSGGIFGRANRYLYKKVSVLLGRKGTIDKPLFVDEPFWVVDTMYYTEIHKQTNPKYFHYLCLTIKFEYFNYGSAIPSMTQSDLSRIVFSVPSSKHQKLIAEYLDKKTAQIDKKIKLLQAKKEKYQELRKTIINEAVTKGINKNVELKDSGVEWIGEIPKHWEMKRIKDFLNQISESGSNIAPNTYVPLENIEPFTGKLLKLLSNESGETTNYFRKGDLLFNKLRPYLGKVLLAEFDGGISGEAIVFRIKNFKKKKISSRYYFYRFLSTRFVFKVNSLTDGVKMPRTNPSKVSNLEISIPPLSEQIEIADYLDEKTSKIDKIILAINKNIKIINEFSKTLINDAVTGKIKVENERLRN